MDFQLIHNVDTNTVHRGSIWSKSILYHLFYILSSKKYRMKRNAVPNMKSITMVHTLVSSVAFIMVSFIYSNNCGELTISTSSDSGNRFKHSKNTFPSFWKDSIFDTIGGENSATIRSSEFISEPEFVITHKQVNKVTLLVEKVRTIQNALQIQVTFFR